MKIEEKRIKIGLTYLKKASGMDERIERIVKKERIEEDKQKKKEYNREYYQRPEIKKKTKKYFQEYAKEYYQRPEVRARKKAYEREAYLRRKKLKNET